MAVLMALVLVLVTVPAIPARAALPGGDTQEVASNTCRLDRERAQRRDVLWNDLSRRYMLASLEAFKNPDAFSRVSREVERRLQQMRRVFGDSCVLDIM